MSEAKHTPGPWFWTTHGTVYSLHGEPPRNRFSAHVQAGRSDDAPWEEQLANARLMAASPALYEALKTAEAHLYAHRLPIDPAITAALSLAEGKEQA